jgi:hypothetical protein
MTVEHVEVLVEEPSMEAALQILLPRLLGSLSFEIYPHQGKNALLKRLPERLNGYHGWLPDDWRILIVVDRDNEDCHALKTKLETMASNAGLRTKSQAGRGTYNVVNRLAIEELEAWFFGDWQAVREAYPSAPKHIPKNKSQSPDAILGGTWEAFERTLKRAGYFRGGLRKIEAARTIAPHMNPDRNTSRSFQVLRDALREMVTNR